MKHLLTLLIFMGLTLSLSAQMTDKHDADMLIYKELTSNYETANWHESLLITRDMLQETQENGIFIAKGDSFQVKSVRSDFYVREEAGKWTVLNDARYPLETMTNLVLNRVNDNKHMMELRHHQYGGKIPKITLPMQNVFDLLARHMKLYTSVTYIDKTEIHAVLIFHHQKLDFIHMIDIKVPTKQLADPKSTIYGELYTNIPQGNVKSLLREQRKFIK